jgi:hypothetical protein
VLELVVVAIVELVLLVVEVVEVVMCEGEQFVVVLSNLKRPKESDSYYTSCNRDICGIYWIQMKTDQHDQYQIVVEIHLCINFGPCYCVILGWGYIIW